MIHLTQSDRGRLPELVALRRDLHAYPELSGQEERTSRIVAERLAALGIEVRAQVGGTGVVGVLRGARAGPCVALRADMDALPIQEATGAPYASRIPGVMHACGHDVHTTCLVGAATLLAEHRDSLPGTVKFLFQPAEEDDRGAQAMLADGALEDPEPSAICGLHTFPRLAAGQIGVRAGPLMAGIDSVRIMVRGAAGHGAAPHRAVDAVVAAAATVVSLQHVVSRRLDPQEPAVVTVGMFHAGVAPNVIAATAELRGTVRWMRAETRDRLPALIRETIESTCRSYGATVEIDYARTLPPVVNDPRVTEAVSRAATRLLGHDAVRPAEPTMGGDDFALYLARVPGCYLWLGTGNPERGIIYDWHDPRYDVDEDALATGSTLLAESALELLNGSHIEEESR
ncbi:MAG: amidohydrolase [Burkholderiales bacterium]|nr:amidohydrolase [Burkholderiales bacterium]